ncbi:MAG: F0F1 ATP synthase subunit delta [Gammaproteobacteria bacterium]|nr:MAG: F0F1 ATP synthase subunit delta [Gammaproteobacteria bacterium]
MAEALTIARPYAQAVFLFAGEHDVLKDWSDMLGLLAAIATDPEMARMIDSPQLTETQLADLFIGIGGERFNEKCHNFIHVLSEARRLQLLPEIAALFEIQRREAEQTVRAELITAFPASDAQQEKVTAALKQRLGRDVELRCTTDAALLGGAIIRAGDLVIDGSVRGKLERLGAALNH